MPWGFFWRGWTCGLSSCFCGSLPPTSAYRVTFPLLQGVMWITVGRNQELWKTCSKWTSPCREWDHCDADCCALYLSLVRLVLGQFMLLEIVQVSSLWVEKGRATADTASCHLSPFDDFQNLNAHQGTTPKMRNGLYFTIGMKAICPDLQKWTAIDDVLMTVLAFFVFFCSSSMADWQKCSIENGLICDPI